MNQNKVEKAVEIIRAADTILIGAGAGLSTAAGIRYSGKRFTDNFPDYIQKYGLTDMYSSAFYPFPTLEEKWGYFSRHIKLNYFDENAAIMYTDLLEAVKDKNYFVITTNGDGQFFKAGFNHNKIFAPQGNYGKFQCEKRCHDTLYDNEKIVMQMVEQQSNCRIPSELIPKCPVCGGNLVAHLRIDQYFVENNDWKKANLNYIEFLQKNYNKEFVLLELGVGHNTPGIIRWPFEKIAADNENNTLIRLNKDDTDAHFNIPPKSIMIKGDITDFITQLKHLG